jgi:hypothetical protein
MGTGSNSPGWNCRIIKMITRKDEFTLLHFGCASKMIHPQWMWTMKAGVFIPFNSSIHFTSFQTVGDWSGECWDWVNKFSPGRRMSENIRNGKETTLSVGKTLDSTARKIGSIDTTISGTCCKRHFQTLLAQLIRRQNSVLSERLFTCYWIHAL